MLKCVGLSNAILLAGLLTASCNQRDEKVMLVSAESYRSKECWVDRNGHWEAFLLLAREERTGVPYLISTKCLVTGNFTSHGEAILHSLNTIRLTDSYGTLQRALPGVNILGNIGSHRAQPDSSSKLYYFNADLVKVPDTLPVYAPENIFQLNDINISFGQFLGLTKDERERLLQTKTSAGKRP